MAKTLPPPPPGCKDWRHAFARCLAAETPDTHSGSVVTFEAPHKGLTEVQRLSFGTVGEYAAREQAERDGQLPPLTYEELQTLYYNNGQVPCSICDRVQAHIYQLAAEARRR